MKVLMFGWEFPPFNSGGLGTACFGLTKALSQTGAKVSFVLPKKITGLTSDCCELVFADPESKEVSLEKAHTFYNPYLSSSEYEKLLRENNETVFGRSLLAEVLRYAINARTLAKRDFGVIHAHDWLSLPAALEVRKLNPKPLVVHIHATEFDRTGNGRVNDAVYSIERRGMEASDRVVTVSQFTKNIVVDKYGINPDKVSVVHNGINKDDYPANQVTAKAIDALKQQGNKIVLFLGRITLQKGPDYFVQVAAKVLQYCPNTYFVMAGSGDMERKIIRDVAYRGLAGRFLFAGFLRGEENRQIYRSADIYVMPSVSEPFGITPLEALIQETPVLISKQSGVNEVISHALKADFWDIDDMADKIVSVLNHSGLKNTLAKNGYEQASQLNWSKAADKCLTIYHELVKNPKPQFSF